MHLAIPVPVPFHHSPASPIVNMDTSPGPRVDQVSSLCFEFVRGASQSDVPLQLAKGISNGHSHLVTVVEALGEHLTSTDIDVRGQATLLLCELIGKLESGLLNADEVHYLSTFLCDRLKDSSLITPYVLQGLVSLINRHPLSDEDAVSIVRSLYKEIHAQSLQQTQRLKLFNILRLMVNKKLEAMRAVSSEFLLGYVQAVDGEKDPRCLMLIFSTVPTIACHIELDPLTEDLFEVVSCYYPIDFTPSPNDPLGVTRDQLATRLRECLIATPAFAEYTIPLVLEKLSSSLSSAKLESLLTLSAGLTQFGVGGVKPFLEQLWDALRQEVFEPVNKDIDMAACEAVTALTRALVTPAQRYGEQNYLDKFINLALKDCLRYFNDSGVLMQSSSRVLLAVCRGSYTACSTILDHCMPVIVQCMTTRDDQNKVCGVLPFVSDLVNLANSFENAPALEHTHSLLTYLLSVVKGVCDVKVMVTLVRVVGALVRSMNQQEAKDCADWILRLGEEFKDSQLSKECDTVWSALGQYQQHVIVECVIPVIRSRLCNVTEYTKATVRIVTISGIISSNREIAAITFPMLLNVLCKIDEGVCCSDSVELAVAVCMAIQCMLKAVSASEPEFCCQCLTELLAVCIQSVVHGTLSKSHAVTDEKVIKSISECFVTHSLTNDIRLSHLLVTQLVEVFSRGDFSNFKITLSQKFEPLNPSSPWQHTQLIAILTAAIDSIKPKVVEGLAEELLPQLLLLCSEHTHEQSCVHAAKCYATIINKLPEGSGLDDMLNTAVDVVHCWFGSEEDTRLRALTWWIWVTKALVLRSHPKRTEFVSLLLSLFSDSTLSPLASDGFKIILDCSDVISSPAHSNIKLLYKQQFFITTAPELVKLFHSNRSSVIRKHCLRSLSHMMHYVPRQVVLSDLPTILPLLMESLQTDGREDDNELQVSTLDSLCTIMHDTPAVMGPHVPALVPRLLELAQASPHMLVRIAAMKCIGGLTILPHHMIFPYSTAVIHGLKVCLDDRKRLVRKHAVSSRSQWCLLGASQ